MLNHNLKLHGECDAPGYDPRRHITARQLRSLGFYLPENLSDASFVRRVAIGLDSPELLEDGTATLRLNVLEPWTAVHEDDLVEAVA